MAGTPATIAAVLFAGRPLKLSALTEAVPGTRSGAILYVLVGIVDRVLPPAYQQKCCRGHPALP